MRRLLFASVALALASAAAPALAQPSAAPAVAPAATPLAAVSDSRRPAEDLAKDANRKPMEMLAFARIRPGETVVDFVPGGGYFTRLFAVAVGPRGKVYDFVPAEVGDKYKMAENARALAAAYANVQAVIHPINATPDAPVADLVWTAQNYHDLHTDLFGKVDIAAFNKAVYAALKPGGLYVIIDHVGPAGAEVPDKLHRIDPAVVRQEVEAAGFKFDGESQVLHNPSDPHTALVFDPSIRGHTDQFAMRFRKPG